MLGNSVPETTRSAPRMTEKSAVTDSEPGKNEDNAVVLRVQSLSARDIKVDRSFAVSD